MIWPKTGGAHHTALAAPLGGGDLLLVVEERARAVELRFGDAAPVEKDVMSGSGSFVSGFRGHGLEAALEATTGRRFVVEELERVGAEVHLAEPAETSALKGKRNMRSFRRAAASSWARRRSSAWQWQERGLRSELCSSAPRCSRRQR